MAANSSANNSTSPVEVKDMVGWFPESGGRGTLSLILTCILTMFICTWVVLHRRVYTSELAGRLHKGALFLKAIVAPEFIAVEGLQEWSQARRMVADCREYTGPWRADKEDFEMVHAFYIGMLALRYRTYNRGDDNDNNNTKVIWPNQYVWLLQRQLIDWKDHASWGLSKESILDKSNTDNFAKVTALFQVSWFVMQNITRTAHDLPLAPLESMTLSYIPLFAATYFFWWDKPKDIMTPSVVDLPNMTAEEKAEFEELAVSRDFDDESLDTKAAIWTNIWALTPRVFETEAEMEMLQKKQEEQDAKRENASNNDNKVPSVETTPTTATENQPKKERVVAHWDPHLYRSKLWPAICLFGASFGALHLICWDTPFPTIVEEWLWRASAFASVVSLLVFMHFEKVVVKWGGPMTIISIVSPAIYLLSRVIMIAGAIAAFRASDPALYDTYVVSDYWLHVL